MKKTNGNMAKIVDVAKLAGVSPASVSRYLNNKDLLTEKTAAKIQTAIEILNYSPNPIAVGLRTKRTKMIAFVVPTMNNLYYIEFFSNMHRLCTEYNYTLCLYSIEENMAFFDKLISELSDYQYDGVIISHLDEPEMIGRLRYLQDRMPVVLVSADRDKAKDFNTVIVDVCDATYCATKSFLENGRKRVAFIRGGFEDSERVVVKEKVRGYLKAVTEKDCPVLLDWPKSRSATQAADGLNAGILGAQFLMSQPEPPDAIICSVDIVAIGCLQYLRENGYSVPENVAVAGFSGITLAGIYDQSIATIVQPLDDIAKAAWNLLLRQINNQTSKKMSHILRADLHNM